MRKLLCSDTLENIEGHGCPVWPHKTESPGDEVMRPESKGEGDCPELAQHRLGIGGGSGGGPGGLPDLGHLAHHVVGGSTQHGDTLAAVLSLARENAMN